MNEKTYLCFDMSIWSSWKQKEEKMVLFLIKEFRSCWMIVDQNRVCHFISSTIHMNRKENEFSWLIIDLFQSKKCLTRLSAFLLLIIFQPFYMTFEKWKKTSPRTSKWKIFSHWLKCYFEANDRTTREREREKRQNPKRILFTKNPSYWPFHRSFTD